MTQFCDAFISYGRADSKAFAIKLQACLHSEGFKVWFDFKDIPLAVDFQNQIDDGIEKSDNFLFIISPHSVNSDYCRKEIELGIKLNKRIIPLLHVMEISRETWQQRYPDGTASDWEAYKANGLHKSDRNMHPITAKLNWMMFQEGIDDFEESFANLIDLLRSHNDYVRQHTQLLVKALEWERNQKQTSYLLVGEEKQQAEDWLKIRFKDEQPPCIPNDLHCEYITESIKNGNNLMAQVFLSYADEERATMEKIRNSLRREGITVWTNTTDIQRGETFEEALKRGIEQADNMVYLLSPEAVNSTFCQLELNWAVSLHKRIIPVLVQKTDPMQVPSALGDLHYINLTDNVKEEDYLVDESELLKALLTDAAYYNEHKILLTKALKWREQQHNPSILLRGYNLRSAETWLQVARTRTQHPPTLLQEEFIAESLRQPPLESLDVFISYSRADSDFARKLNDALQIQGKTTWFDQESIASGADFQQEIYGGIKACDNFLFILSSRSLNSPYCADEVEYAASLNKRFVTVLHRQVNTRDLHPELAKVHWLDFNRHQGDFNPNFNQLVRIIDTDREHLHSHTKWLQRGLEWERKEKSDDLLLRGSECAIALDWLQSTEEQKKKPAATCLQKAFIEGSQKAIKTAELEEERRQAEMLRLQEERTQEAEARLAQQKFFLAAVSTLLVAAIGVSVVAIVERREALMQRQRAAQVTEGQIKALSRFSFVLIESALKLDALVEAIRAGALLKNLTQVKPEIKQPILTALQAVVYEKGFKERNRLNGHKASVYSVAISPDGKMIVSASSDGIVKLWNLQGQLLQTFQGHRSSVYNVAISPDGKTIASASSDRTVKLWNLEGELQHTLQKHEGWVLSVAFSPDGKTIASASSDRTVKLWNLEGELQQTLDGHQDYVVSVVFSPDGKTLVSASHDQSIKLWSLQGELLQTFQGHKDWVSSVALSPDGKTLASVSRDKTVKLWNLQGQLLETLDAHKDWVISVAFSLDGETMVSAGEHGTVKLWNLQGQLLQTLEGHQYGVISVTISPDGKTIAYASSDGSVKLWKLQGQLLQTLEGHEKAVESVAISPDGKTIASASQDRSVKLWNLKSQLLHALEGHEDWVVSVTFSPDGKTIASASHDRSIKLWNLQGQMLQTLEGHESWVTSVAFSPDGKFLASASRDGTVKLWNFQGQLLQTFPEHESWVTSLGISPDGKTIASGSSDGTVKLWNFQGQLLQALRGHEDMVESVVFSPDGKLLASASDDTTIKFWNLQGQLLQTLQGHEDAVVSVAFSPDGKLLASASDDTTIKLWNFQGQLLQTLQGHENTVESVVFSPDGKLLASASQNIVILWNLTDFTLDSLMEDACAWIGDYLEYNAPESDRHLCEGY